MRKTLLALMVITAGIVFTGCSQQAATTTEPTDTSTQKVGDTTKSGTIMVAGDKVFLKEASGSQMEIDSYAVDLKTMDGQQVTVTGQYSGDTLFVGSVSQ